VEERISKEELTFYLLFKPERREENKVSLLVQKQALLYSSLSFSSLHDFIVKREGKHQQTQKQQ
jgi:hypothetical protein